jgi:hypothetical protein
LDPAWAFKRQCLIIRRPLGTGWFSRWQRTKKKSAANAPNNECCVVHALCTRCATSANCCVVHEIRTPVLSGVFKTQLTASAEEMVKRAMVRTATQRAAPIPSPTERCARILRSPRHAKVLRTTIRAFFCVRRRVAKNQSLTDDPSARESDHGAVPHELRSDSQPTKNT